MHIICNGSIMKICGKFLRCCCVVSFNPSLSLSPCNCIQEVFARIPLFFTGLISLPWQRNDSCYWFRCVCVCGRVCGRWRCHRSMPAAVTLDIYLLILLILLKSAAGAEAEAGSYACTHPFEISCHLALSLSLSHSIFLSLSHHLLWDIYTVVLVASSWQMNFVWLAK